MRQKQAKFARRMLRRNKFKILNELLNEVSGYSFRTRFGFAWHILWAKTKVGK
jgi:hypothetical protein